MKISEVKDNMAIANLPVKVKTAGKRWIDTEGIHCQSLVLQDASGEISAISKQTKIPRNVFIKGAEVTICRGFKESDKPLVILEIVQLGLTYDQTLEAKKTYTYDDEPDWDSINRGKIRCTFIYSAIQKGKIDITDGKGELDIGKIGRLVNYTMSGVMDELPKV